MTGLSNPSTTQKWPERLSLGWAVVRTVLVLALGCLWIGFANRPTAATWESVVRGHSWWSPPAHGFPEGFPAFGYYPISDLYWGMAFGWGGGWGLLVALLLVQISLLGLLGWTEISHRGTGAAVLFLPWFLPGWTSPGALPLAHACLGALWALGTPLGWVLGFVWLVLWSLSGPFAWTLGLSLGLHREWHPFARAAAAGLGLLALIRDGWLGFHHWDEWTQGGSLTLFPLGSGMWAFFFLLAVASCLGLTRLVSPAREWLWESFLGLGRFGIAAMFLVDLVGGWGILGPFPARQDPWREHEPFAELARVDGDVLARAPSVTHSRWVWVHAFLQSNLGEVRWLERPPANTDSPALIWIGQPSARAAAADLVQALSANEKLTVAYLCGPVAILFPHSQSQPSQSGLVPPPELAELHQETPLARAEPNLWKEFRGAKLALSQDPAAEACLALAWFQAKRPALVLGGGPKVPSAILQDGKEILAFARGRAQEGMARQQGLGFAIMGEWQLTQHLLDQTAAEVPPFEKAFRLAQVAFFLRKALDLQPEDLRTRHLFQEIMAAQGALDLSAEWDDALISRRRGMTVPKSMTEWKVLDLANQLAFFHPSSGGFSLARMRQAVALGLKGQALNELSSADPLLAGPEGARMRLALLFEAGYLREGQDYLRNLQEMRLDRDLGLVEWPRAGGAGPAALWRFPAKLWYGSLAEATLAEPTPAGSSQIEQLITELSGDLARLRQRESARFPEVAGQILLGGPVWTPSGFAAWQQWKWENDLHELATMLQTQVNFLRRLRPVREVAPPPPPGNAPAGVAPLPRGKTNGSPIR